LNSTDERSGGINTTSIMSKIADKILMKVRMALWLEFGKSDGYVKKALKMKGVPGPALTSHMNYELFVEYVDKAEKYRLDKW
ncbi:hypothetical protein PHYSODRAFT_390023, partial [Phytophthora sojae]